MRIEVQSNKQLMDYHKEAILTLEELNISSCALRSNSYVHINYLGQPTAVYPREELVQYYLDEGYNILTFTTFSQPKYSTNRTFLKAFPVLAEKNHFIILGDASRCLPHHTVADSYLVGTNIITTLIYKEETDTNPCNVMFETNKVFKKLCNLLNGHTEEK